MDSYDATDRVLLAIAVNNTDELHAVGSPPFCMPSMGIGRNMDGSGLLQGIVETDEGYKYCR